MGKFSVISGREAGLLGLLCIVSGACIFTPTAGFAETAATKTGKVSQPKSESSTKSKDAKSANSTAASETETAPPATASAATEPPAAEPAADPAAPPPAGEKTAGAEPPPETGDGTKPPPSDPNPYDTYEQFMAKHDNWGLGVGIGMTVLGDKHIKAAEPVNGTVRVTESESVRRGIWLETHYRWFAFGKNERFGFGPFLGVQFSDNDGLFDSMGAGFMWTMKRRTGSPQAMANNLGFNVAFGVVSSSIDVLGSGVKENEPLPAGEEAVRLKKKDDVGGMILFSFNFLSGYSEKDYSEGDVLYKQANGRE